MSPANLLEEIIERVRSDLKTQKERLPMETLESRISRVPAARDFTAAVSKTGPIHVIAEIKRKSPSVGSLKTDLDPGMLAQEFERAGASALSILTNTPYFGGTLEDLEKARAITGLPLLRKDFIIDPYQIFESRIHGADAILLIVAALSDKELRSLMATATDLGLSVLVEVHDTVELKRALALEPHLIGINNRNLKDLSIDLSTTLSLEPLVPASVCLVAESGYKTSDDIQALANTRVKAVLVGESLLRQRNPGQALESWLK